MGVRRTEIFGALGLLALAATIASARVSSGEPSPAGGAPSASTRGASEEASESACAERIAGVVQRRYEGVRDFSARFEQTTRRVSFRGSQALPSPVSRGTVVIAKPGKMRWSYEEPEPSLVVSDGATVWIYDPVAKEAQSLPAEEGFLSGAASQFVLGRGNLLRDFGVTASSCDADAVELELVPLEAAPYERVRLLVDANRGEIHRTTIVDLFGNVTELVFSDRRTNLDPPASRFEFSPPAGVRVIELAPDDAGP